jgi:ethanolaminephosphotransferase
MTDSPNMPAKQREMDEIVREIYHAMEKHDHLASSLLVLSGDHGMNEAGNHGGSSSGEVSTALLFISPKFMSAFTGFESPLAGSESFEFYGRVEQSDIAPTLAALLGFPVPRNNLGMIIPTFLELWAQGA